MSVFIFSLLLLTVIFCMGIIFFSNIKNLNEVSPISMITGQWEAEDEVKYVHLISDIDDDGEHDPTLRRRKLQALVSAFPTDRPSVSPSFTKSPTLLNTYGPTIFAGRQCSCTCTCELPPCPVSNPISSPTPSTSPFALKPSIPLEGTETPTQYPTDYPATVCPTTRPTNMPTWIYN